MVLLSLYVNENTKDVFIFSTSRGLLHGYVGIRNGYLMCILTGYQIRSVNIRNQRSSFSLESLPKIPIVSVSNGGHTFHLQIKTDSLGFQFYKFFFHSFLEEKILNILYGCVFFLPFLRHNPVAVSWKLIHDFFPFSLRFLL